MRDRRYRDPQPAPVGACRKPDLDDLGVAVGHRAPVQRLLHGECLDLGRRHRRDHAAVGVGRGEAQLAAGRQSREAQRDAQGRRTGRGERDAGALAAIGRRTPDKVAELAGRAIGQRPLDADPQGLAAGFCVIGAQGVQRRRGQRAPGTPQHRVCRIQRVAEGVAGAGLGGRSDPRGLAGGAGRQRVRGREAQADQEKRKGLWAHEVPWGAGQWRDCGGWRSGRLQTPAACITRKGSDNRND